MNLLLLTQCHNVRTVLSDLEILKKLEFSNSELIAEGKDFEHSDLSYIWYDKHVDGLHWDIIKHDLIYERGKYKISITDLLKCNIKRKCYLNYEVNKFLGTFHNIKEFDKFIISLHNVIKIRINILKQK